MKYLYQKISKRLFLTSLLLSLILFSEYRAKAQHSVARQWNEVLLEGIRNDFARPTVHARNLFHTSVIMYDAWAIYEDLAEPYFLGNTLGNYTCEFTAIAKPANIKAAQEEAMSYAAYRLLKHRFANSPDGDDTFELIDNLFAELGYNPAITSTNYGTNVPAALGNYLAANMIAFGETDGANEQNDYENIYYDPINPPLAPTLSGNPDIEFPNNWQPLAFDVFIDQSGNVIANGSPDFLSPEWGNVVPFSLSEDDKTVFTNDDGDNYVVYHDPGVPPYIDQNDTWGTNALYKWHFFLVSVWSSHLDPADGVMWDISPASIGNIQDYPTDFADHASFYNLLEGGDPSIGYEINPKTGEPYEPQMVLRGDYTRVLAEFWADGPDSETPPGHWFTLLNYVNDHPDFEKRWNGQGPILDDLEWDIKAYFALGGTMHDAAITAWGIKGWYDYIRPVSAIRYMAERGQSSDPDLPNYSPQGLPLIPGFSGLVYPVDPLFGDGSNLYKVKIKAWRGPGYIEDPETDVAGVDWILAEDWWPYQRPSFITPPFAGYVSGHSTYSRAAAELLTLMTGDEYFPGGMGEFIAPANEFLVFEDGPSMDVKLQWAKYRDASDQCSMSRIWGGIHPPADDIPGRLIGEKIGIEAFEFAKTYIDPNGKPDVLTITANIDTITDAHVGTAAFNLTLRFNEDMDTLLAPNIFFTAQNPLTNTLVPNNTASYWLNNYTYQAVYDVNNSNEKLDNIALLVANGQNMGGVTQEGYETFQLFYVQTQNPTITSLTANTTLLTDASAGIGTFALTLTFDEPMDAAYTPVITFPAENPAATLTFNADNSQWMTPLTYIASYDVADAAETLPNIDIEITGGQNMVANGQQFFETLDFFHIDTQNPTITALMPQQTTITDLNEGTVGFELTVIFSEKMDVNTTPIITFPTEDPTLNTMVLNVPNSDWQDPQTYIARYAVIDANETLPDIDVQIVSAVDSVGNIQEMLLMEDAFGIDTENPLVVSVEVSTDIINLETVGTATFGVTVTFSEAMDTLELPQVLFPVENPLATTLSPNNANSKWLDTNSFEAWFDVAGTLHTLLDIDLQVAMCLDAVGNSQANFVATDLFDIDIDSYPVGIETPITAETTAIQLYPNPAKVNDHFYLTLATQEAVRVEIWNLQGQVVHHQQVAPTLQPQTVSIPTHTFEQGLYLVRVSGEHTHWTSKVEVLK